MAIPSTREIVLTLGDVNSISVSVVAIDVCVPTA